MAKRQPSSQRTSKIAKPTERESVEGRTKRVIVVDPDDFDEARAQAHERARERSGSDD
jgi:hypothetical protein